MITIKYILQGRYKGDNSQWNPWQDESKDDKIDRIRTEYRTYNKSDICSNREFRIVRRTITETDEVVFSE